MTRMVTGSAVVAGAAVVATAASVEAASVAAGVACAHPAKAMLATMTSETRTNINLFTFFSPFVQYDLTRFHFDAFATRCCLSERRDCPLTVAAGSLLRMLKPAICIDTYSESAIVNEVISRLILYQKITTVNNQFCHYLRLRKVLHHVFTRNPQNCSLYLAIKGDFLPGASGSNDFA